MERLPKTFVVLFALAIPAAAPPLLQAPAGVCFTLGSTTYQLGPAATAPDYRVTIARTPPSPGVRFLPVERPEVADFVLVDDDGARQGDACKSAGTIKTIKIVSGTEPADLMLGPAQGNDAADFTLFVRSSRISIEHAAALFAVLRSTQKPGKLAVSR